MRTKVDWLDIIVNFASFASLILILSLARMNLPLKIILAFAVSVGITLGWSYVKRRVLKHKAEQYSGQRAPKRARVYNVSDVKDINK